MLHRNSIGKNVMFVSILNDHLREELGTVPKRVTFKVLTEGALFQETVFAGATGPAGSHSMEDCFDQTVKEFEKCTE